MVLNINIDYNYILDYIFFFIIIFSLMRFVGFLFNIIKNQQIQFYSINLNHTENTDSTEIDNTEKQQKEDTIKSNNTETTDEQKQQKEKPKRYMAKSGRVYNKTEPDEDDIILTPEQQAEFWAEYYYTKSKKTEKKDDIENKDPINQKTEKLFKLFWWFFILNFITLLMCLVYEVIDMNGFINYAMTTKLHSHKDIYAETIKKIISLNLDEMNVTPAGESFIHIIQSQIIDETLTEDNLITLIKLCNIQDEHINSKYKLLYCMLETFINHYQDLSTQDTGKIRLIVRLCYTYCTTVELPYNKFDLIRIIRFIYNNYYKK